MDEDSKYLPHDPEVIIMDQMGYNFSRKRNGREIVRCKLCWLGFVGRDKVSRWQRHMAVRHGPLPALP
jgi:hypothetical protein